MSINKNSIYALVIFALVQSAEAQDINVQFEANKKDYICGEPIILRTTIKNVSGQNIKSRNYAWGRNAGFTMYIAKDGNDFDNILSMQTITRLKVSIPPKGYKFFRDRHFLPGNLTTNQKAERLDMLIIPKSGDYGLKAVLKKRDGTTYASKPIQFKVLPLKDKQDSISRLGDQNFLINLGSSIYYAHYVEEVWGGFPPGKSFGLEKFEEIASVILKEHKDSVFREYVIYADIMIHCEPGMSVRELKKRRRVMGLAESFIKEYPNSWLLPEVYRKQFQAHVYEKNKDKAEEVRKKVLQVAPNASVLRFVKGMDLSKLNKAPQK